MLISVVIPAFEEEGYLGRTLDSLNVARALLAEGEGVPVEVVVVDNDSPGATAGVARGRGAVVVRETVHNIAKVRNTGAGFARGDVLVFILLFRRRESAWRGWYEEVPRRESRNKSRNFHKSCAPPGADKAIDSRGGRVLL